MQPAFPHFQDPTPEQRDPFAEQLARDQICERRTQLLPMIWAWLRAKTMRLIRAAVVRMSVLKRPEYSVDQHYTRYHAAHLLAGWSLKLLRITEASVIEDAFDEAHDRFNLCIDGWMMEELAVDDDETQLIWRSEGSLWWRRDGQSITAASLQQGGIWILQLVKPRRSDEPHYPPHPNRP